MCLKGQFFSSHLIFNCGPIWAANQLPPGVSVLGESLQLPPCLAYLPSICIQVTAPGVSRPPSLPFPLWIPYEGLLCRIGCRLAKVWPIHLQRR
ncbi:hypothetical protein DPMN_193795 [Dreissena polymorpha]|uniref:Uncharacterized protein n=1 Tax=Dreissena polymorpha TaxID=45954 RepID=A0A9D3Y4U1_DREPO|nr:hypothetical protein DPMN_193795 [Dreissena polymorpha]